MGAQVFNELIVTRGDTRAALQEARAEARAYNGHQEGYSGDIQTCDDFTHVYKHPRFETKAFDKWEENQLKKMSKGDCKYVVIDGAVGKRLKEKCGYKGKKGIIVVYFFGWGRC